MKACCVIYDTLSIFCRGTQVERRWLTDTKCFLFCYVFVTLTDGFKQFVS
jgi:hypothetical protein